MLTTEIRGGSRDETASLRCRGLVVVCLPSSSWTSLMMADSRVEEG